jgi:uncharacterized protein (DUF305 family)
MSVVLFGLANIVMAQDAPLVQPGAIGEAAKKISASKAIEIAANSYTPEDVSFMQNMIPHHNQAVQMSDLVGERTNLPALVEIAGRIDASQIDEIGFMQAWLKARGETQPDPTAHAMMDMSHKMAGMASPMQMKELASLKGMDFDKMFLQLMIKHHTGAVNMVKELHNKSGSAYDPAFFEFTNDVVNDQNAEIGRMNALYVSLVPDPRANLKAGFRDAGEASLNVELVATLPKPAGFFDPENPMGLPPAKLDKEGKETIKDGKTVRSSRRPLLSFSNTDMAFSGDKLVVGNYHGFNAYQLKANGTPELISSVVCPGGQGDVSIVGDLLIMSVQDTRARLDCGLGGVTEKISAERFRGIRIFDVSDYTRPVQVGQVQTCRGSHTHSVVAQQDGKIIVYNSGTSGVRDGEEMPGCVGNIAGDERTAMFRIDVIEIPIDDPSKSRIVDSPAVFADPKTGNIAGMWQGGDHGEDTQSTNTTNQCHDITVFPSLKIAAGACSGNGIIFDISDPYKPTRIDEVMDPGFAYWHSATFNNDGTKVLFTDEWGGGGRPRCLAHDPKTWGANAFYDIVDRKLTFKSNYKLPAPQVETENCVAHNGSAVPVPGRDIFAQAWYQGGLSVIDFTDSSNPHEIAYFDRGPVYKEELVMGGYWSTYWYNGKIYGTEIARGLDVIELKPSEFLSANEIAAAKLADMGANFNPQQQFPVSWPAEPVVARAYIDQLNRSEALSASLVADLNTALDNSDASLKDGKSNRRLSNTLKKLAVSVKRDKDAATNKRRTALGKTLNDIAARLR